MDLFAESIPPVRRHRPEELFLLRFEAEPLPGNTEAMDSAGAYVNCWVDGDDLRTAAQRAMDCIREQEWNPIRLEHWDLVSRRLYIEDTQCGEEQRRDWLERADEAFKYGIALTFFCWPIDAPDADEEPI